ncbi:Spc7 kinetochore protein-domain-containing protein [Obelidium mucronatum]|nr:Spc7 kinetochore protein-domain-containing protein [Obelidium mucronatum]
MDSSPAQPRPANARKSLGRRVSFAQMAHVRIFEKDDKKPPPPPAAYSPIAGLDLSQRSSHVASTKEIPDLSSVRKNSDAFNLRLSLDNRNEDSQDMSLDDVSVTLPSHDTSFDVTIKDAAHHHEENARRDSVFAFFEGGVDSEDEENASPTQPLPIMKSDQSPNLNMRRRDSVAPFFQSQSPNATPTSQHNNNADKRVSLLRNDQDVDEVDMDDDSQVMESASPCAGHTKTNEDYRRRDSVAPFFHGPEAEEEDDMDQCAEVSPAQLPLSQDYRRRDSVAPFFQQAELTENGSNISQDYRRRDSVAPFFNQSKETMAENTAQDYRRRDSVAPFFNQGNVDAPSPANSVQLQKQDYRRRDSVAPFFNSDSPMSSREDDLIEDGVASPAADDTVNLEEFGSTVKPDYRSRDSVAAFFDTTGRDLADESMDLANDSSFLEGQQLQRNGSSLVQDSDLDDSFASESAEMELTAFTFPKLPPAAEKAKSATPESSTRVLRSSSPKKTPATYSKKQPSNAGSPSAKSLSRTSTPSNRSGKKTPVSSVSKGFVPAVSSPLAQSFSTPSSSTRSSARRGPTPRFSAVASNVESPTVIPKATPKSIIKTSSVQTPLLLNFVKAIKSESKSAKANVVEQKNSIIEDDDEDEEDGEDNTDMMVMDDTFNKPSDIFSRVLGGKTRASLKASIAAKPDETVILHTNGSGLVDEQMPESFDNPEASVSAVVAAVVEDKDGLTEAEKDEDKITLNDFLQATGLHFIDGLSTTLRRETSAFNLDAAGVGSASNLDFSRAACLYMPELRYLEETCKVLTEYVEEGRQSMRDLEADIEKNTPSLFYMYADACENTQDDLLVKFKLLKSVARLKTKESWYGWREKLLGPFHEAVVQNSESLKKDLRRIQEAQANLSAVVDAAEVEVQSLQERKDSLSKKYAEYVSSEVTQVDQALEEQKLMSESLLQLPLSINEKISAHETTVLATMALESKKKEAVEKINALNTEYESLCEMMPDDVVGIQDNHELLHTITRWRPIRTPQGSALALGGGLMKIHLTSSTHCESVPEVYCEGISESNTILDKAMQAFNGIRCGEDLLPELMAQASHNNTRLRVLLGDIEEACKECDIRPAVSGNELHATAIFFNYATATRFSVVFSFPLDDIVYPYGVLGCEVHIMNGQVSEERILRLVKGVKREYGRLRVICKELQVLLEGP